jgi:hypothetical protein
MKLKTHKNITYASTTARGRRRAMLGRPKRGDCDDERRSMNVVGCIMQLCKEKEQMCFILFYFTSFSILNLNH